MIRLTVQSGGHRSGAPLAELLNTEFLAVSMAASEIGGRLPIPALRSSIDFSAAACAALLTHIETAGEATLIAALGRRIPGETTANHRERLAPVLDALRRGAAADGLVIDAD
jgi:hypothetical protein